VTQRWLDQHRSNFSNRRVCVTGGAGFIGSHLCHALDALGARVTVLDNLVNGKRENLSGCSSRVELTEGSILDEAALARAVAGSEIIFHLAALGSVPASLESPVKYQECNATGTLRVLEAARAAGVRRVVYSASSSAYGNTPTLPKVESMSPDPLSPYAVTKLEGEHLCRAWSVCYGISTISLRYFNIFGPRQRPDSQYAAVIPRFAAWLRAGTQPTIFGDGLQTRDFTHVDNAVHANLLAASTTAALAGEVVNIGCGSRFSLLDLLREMNAVLGTSIASRHEPARRGDVRDSLAAIGRAREVIGYAPVKQFAEGLSATLCS
jgi:UDP-glucose 4-epimerase